MRIVLYANTTSVHVCGDKRIAQSFFLLSYIQLFHFSVITCTVLILAILCEHVIDIHNINIAANRQYLLIKCEIPLPHIITCRRSVTTPADLDCLRYLVLHEHAELTLVHPLLPRGIARFGSVAGKSEQPRSGGLIYSRIKFVMHSLQGVKGLPDELILSSGLASDSC